MRSTIIVSGVFGILLAALAAYTGFIWTVNRVYVNEGENLMLRYKGPLVFGD